MDCSAVNSRAPDVDLGVIYTGERELVGPLLSTLQDSLGEARGRLILVDNSSPDGVRPWRSVFRETKLLANERRLGYAANLNRILAASSARYVLLLNTDMLFAPRESCVAKMVRFMDSHPRCGVAGCRVYRPDGAYGFPARRFPTLPMVLARRLPRIRSLSQHLSDYMYLDRDVRESYECDWLSGCFLMVRREAAAQVGGFDLRFKKYFEDVDLCRRMSRSGHEVWFHGETYCYHLEQAASRRWFSRDMCTHLASYVRWLRTRSNGPAPAPSPTPSVVVEGGRRAA